MQGLTSLYIVCVFMDIVKGWGKGAVLKIIRTSDNGVIFWAWQQFLLENFKSIHNYRCVNNGVLYISRWVQEIRSTVINKPATFQY